MHGPYTLHEILKTLVQYSGLGLLEYLTFFEDVGMEPIMAVWSGEFAGCEIVMCHMSY